MPRAASATQSTMKMIPPGLGFATGRFDVGRLVRAPFVAPLPDAGG